MRVQRRGIAFDVEAGTHDEFWQWFQADWEEETFDILEAFVTSDTTYVDVGAWIGPTLLSAATRARHAVGYEADPTAFAVLERNVGLNAGLARRIELAAAAVGPRAGTTRLGSVSSPGDSMSSVLFGAATSHWTTPAVRLADESRQRGWSRPLFVKIDIEGGEYGLMPSLAEWIRELRPTLYLSLHPHFVLRAAAPRQEMAALGSLGESYRRIATLLEGYRHVWGPGRRRLVPADLVSLDVIASCRHVVASDVDWECRAAG